MSGSDPNRRAAAVAQVRSLREQAARGGLRFRAYLPPTLAIWLLDQIEEGSVADPSEAVFEMLQQCRYLEPHKDLRRELLRRVIAASEKSGRVAAVDFSWPELDDIPAAAEWKP